MLPIQFAERDEAYLALLLFSVRVFVHQLQILQLQVSDLSILAGPQHRVSHLEGTQQGAGAAHAAGVHLAVLQTIVHQ
jgi:hypothetical protein